SHRHQLQHRYSFKCPLISNTYELYDSPVPIAGIARFIKQFDPAVRIVVKLGGQHPTQEKLALLGRSIGINLYETAPRSKTLYFAHRTHGSRPFEIMRGIDRNDRIETIVGKRQLVGATQMQAPDDFRLAMHQGIL